MNFLKNWLLHNYIQVIRYSSEAGYISGSLTGNNLFVGQRLTHQQILTAARLAFVNVQRTWYKICCVEDLTPA